LTDEDRVFSLNSAPATPERLLRVGLVARPHGLRGALRINLDNLGSESLQVVRRVWLEIDGMRHSYQIHSATPVGRGTMRVQLDSITTIESAEALQGATVLVAQADLPVLRDGEFYDFRAIGCEVVTVTGRRLGVVAEIFPTGANDVFVVRDGASEVLVPDIADIVKSLDFDAHRIVVDEVPGLLD